jgi:hypothetical protein
MSKLEIKARVEPDLRHVMNGGKSKLFHLLLAPNTSMLGTESGTQYVVKCYKTLQNVESATIQGPKPL